MDKREEYLKRRVTFLKMPLKKLEELLGELHEKRYVQQDIEYESQHRMASSVYLQRTRVGDSLIFHLKEFVR